MKTINLFVNSPHKKKYMNMKTKFIIAGLLISALHGCSDGPKQEGLRFFNDFESLKGWAKAPTMITLAKGTAYSGNYALRMDTMAAYSQAFQLKFKDISNKPIKKVKFSVYAMFPSVNTNCQAKIVAAVDGPDKPNLFWDAVHIQDFVKESNKWVQVTGEVNMQKNGLNNPENTFILYVWNTGKQVVFADDFELEFVE